MSSRETVREVYFAPVILCCVMAGCAFATGELAHIRSRSLLVPYLSTSIAITFVSLLLTMFWWVVQLASTKADAPLSTVRDKLKERAPFLLLPALVFPLFLASFTATKTAIPFLVGYSWDPFWAAADRLIFGEDVWRIAHHWLGSSANRPLEWFYVAAWGIGLMFVMALVPLNSSPKFTARFFTAMMSTWLLGGFVLAYMFSAAGPVFAHLVTADPSVQFTSLRLLLLSTLTPHGPIWETQLYLPTELHSHIAAKGGGISAMPSMHLATVAIYVIGAWRTRWLVPAILMWVTIFVSSGYFGYHYWIDGIAGAAIAALCWVSAGRLSSMVASSGVVPTRRRSREVAGAQPIPDVR